MNPNFLLSKPTVSIQRGKVVLLQPAFQGKPMMSSFSEGFDHFRLLYQKDPQIAFK